MYKRILVALENGRADATIIPHVTTLARQMSAEVVLLHVADGYAARYFDQLQLAESAEMREDRAYLERIAGEMRAAGLVVETQLALGNPPTEIVKIAAARECSLIAMTSHGHRWLADIFCGSTISHVRHHTTIPMLILKAEKRGR
ncbi:MAG: universal stress protein [Opitutaceae bacterium]|jgi:manganese transport protein|nr:universal stress protein [Opitutaceae bacterium]